MNDIATAAELSAKDFTSDQEIRWCPGCGDYAIVKSVRKTLAEIGTPTENVVFVSGIGCAARFPYYMATYGFHTIHGRAPTIATGVKLANPELDVWVVGGDGDMLSIGGNHTLHALRRNVDLNILLFNNEIYGLTKGQYSPTSREGTQSPSTPMGSVDHPVSATSFALGAGARFVARSIDTDQKHMPEVLKRAHAHKGASFVEIFQNCIVYNDGAFADFAEKKAAADTQLHVAHGEPLVFGAERNRGIRINHDILELEVVSIGENGVTLDDILVHDETNLTLAGWLARMETPEFPVAIGVLYCDPQESYEAAVWRQVEEAKKKSPAKGLNSLLQSGHTWTVEPH
ncbi:MAG: 2-oxoacid:ferredoxin oxidoreductase subunit beta [Rhodospirillaceae bacterium]|nr:2-oxoacid:ferredoxin oxidoreductase subunit beta [Rhodospirillaceae bacterium]